MKKLIFLIVSAALAGTLYWNYRAGQDLAEKTRLEQKEAQRVAKLESELAREKRRNQAGVQSQMQTVEQLKQQLETEKSSLEILRQRLDTARNRGLPGSDYTSTIESRLQQSKDAIQELDAQIKSVKAQEAELGSQGKIAQEQQKLNNRQNQLELEAQIQQQQQLIKDTQSQIKPLRSQGLVDPDTRARITQLQQQEADQKAQLQNLKDQRPQLAVQGSAAVNGVSGQVQDSRTQLRLSREQLEERDRREKAVAADLEKQLGEAKRDVGGQKQALSQLQAEFQAQRDKTAAVHDQLKQEESRLQSLLSN